MERTLAIAAVENLARLVEYQRGSVVSRQLIKKETGNVTLFAFDEGEGLAEHTAPFDALAHIIDGTAEIAIEGKPHTLNAGEAILMPAHESHAVKAVARFKMILTMIRS